MGDSIEHDLARERRREMLEEARLIHLGRARPDENRASAFARELKRDASRLLGLFVPEKKKGGPG